MEVNDMQNIGVNKQDKAENEAIQNDFNKADNSVQAVVNDVQNIDPSQQDTATEEAIKKELEEDDEFHAEHSPKILAVFLPVWNLMTKLISLLQTLIMYALKTVQPFLPAGCGFGAFVLAVYLLECNSVPLGYDDLPNFPARLQYIARISALGLFPVILSWFLGHSVLLSRLVQSAVRDLFIVMLALVALATFHPVEQMHWIFIYVAVSGIFRVLYWFASCYKLNKLQEAMEAPLMLSLVFLVLYTFLSIVGQEMGMMERVVITPSTADVTETRLMSTSLCNIVERIFCGSSRPLSQEANI